MSPTGDGFFLARLERTATCTARSTNHPRRAKLLGIARSRVRRNIFACSSFSAFLFTLQSEICGFPSGATLFFRRFRRVIRRIFASACASLLSLSLSLSLSKTRGTWTWWSSFVANKGDQKFSRHDRYRVYLLINRSEQATIKENSSSNGSSNVLPSRIATAWTKTMPTDEQGLRSMKLGRCARS